ncbi:MAG: coat protein [Plant associated deltapartitivirus 3]|nr:MAG: coat protein [Plant associated deltapartitivirus 3]
MEGDQRNPDGGYKSTTRQAAIWLQDNAKLMYDFQRQQKYRRYVDLRLQEIFDQLQGHYGSYFQSISHHFKTLMSAQTLPNNFAGRPMYYLSAVYLSHWINDLYVSNRRACFKLSDAAYNDYYYMDLIYSSDEYDNFLTAANASIRPTNIKNTHEDTLYIPRFGPTFDENHENNNYFRLTNFHYDIDLFLGLLDIIRERRLFKLEKLEETTLGRPFWLLDWHSERCYAWFPAELNYAEEDIVLAYIIGVACTPKLGPRDHDEWQYFLLDMQPANLQNLRRIRAPTYRGAIEANVIESGPYRFPADVVNTVINKNLATGQQQAPTTGAKDKQAVEPPSKRRSKRQLAPEKGQPSKSAATSIQGSQAEQVQQEEEEQEAESAVNTAVPNTLVLGRSPTINNPPFFRTRIVTYMYYRAVTSNSDVTSRRACLRRVIKGT